MEPMLSHPSVEEILARINNLTNRLRITQVEMAAHLVEAPAGSSVNVFLENETNLEIIMDFKKAIDDIRHLLWLYVEEISRSPAMETNGQGALLQRATDMLSVLSQNPPLPSSNGARYVESYFDGVLRVVEACMMKLEQPSK